jgi:hypothetical protein
MEMDHEQIPSESFARDIISSVSSPQDGHLIGRNPMERLECLGGFPASWKHLEVLLSTVYEELSSVGSKESQGKDSTEM